VPPPLSIAFYAGRSSAISRCSFQHNSHRASKIVRLKVKHIDTAQKIIRVEQLKGRKDRNVMLSAETLDLLRANGPFRAIF
jgi:integrase